MTIVILGSSGNLGTVLVEYLSNKLSERIFCIDHLKSKSNLCKPKLRFCNFDFLVEGFPPELIKNFLEIEDHFTFINLIAKDYPVLYSLKSSGFNNSPFELSLEELCKSYEITLGSSYKLIQEVQKLNISSYHIIFTGSIYGISLPQHRIYNDTEHSTSMRFKPVAYSLAKSAQIMLLKEAVRSFGSINKRFNMISFGGINLDQDKEFQIRYKKITPSNEMVSLSEVCSSFYFMISHSPPSLNGTNLIVDGGWSCAN